MRRLLASLCFILSSAYTWSAVPSYELTSATDVAAWTGAHDISSQSYVAGKGMELVINGIDPFLSGPWRDFTNRPMLATIRIYSEAGGVGEFFWFTKPDGAVGGNEVGFVVPKGSWREITVKLPALPAQSALRLDPPGISGKCWVQWIRFQELIEVPSPAWGGASGQEPGEAALRINSGRLSLTQSATQMGRYVLDYDGNRMAVGWDRPWLCYQNSSGSAVWVDMQSAPASVQLQNGVITVFSIITDPDGATWRFTQLFSPSAKADGIELSSTVSVDRPRNIYFLPLCMLFPEARERGLLPGMEYLDPQDTSSSKADFEVDDYKRRVPDPEKLTFPMMSMQANGRWISLNWQQNKMVQTVYDTPDRLFNSGKNLMGAILSDWDQTYRDQQNPISQFPETLTAARDYTAKLCIVAGEGSNVVPSMQAYVARYGLCPLPNPGYDLQGYIKVTAAGWLDTGQKVGSQYRPLAWYGATWSPQYSSEVAYNIDWLARNTTDAILRSRLQLAVTPSWEDIPDTAINNWGIASNNYPIASLIYGFHMQNVQSSKSQVPNFLAPVRPDGTVPYVPPATGINYGRTHWADHANGMSGQQIAQALKHAVFSGDAALQQEAVRLCRLLSIYDDQAPRGAQTWEVPLHTPDIMASGWMCIAYLYAYELTGDQQLLNRAITWAWTGVPFVYLVNPTEGAVGPYATIPVLGATNWTGSWTGLPVQWCGLFYADAIRRLERFDPTGPWNQIWRGITASGIQQGFTKSFDPQFEGWLPDSFNLRPQLHNGVAINPAMVFSLAAPYYSGKPLWDYRIYRSLGIGLQLPGRWLADTSVQKDAVSFNVELWREGKVQVMGLSKAPEVWLDGVKQTGLAIIYEASVKGLWVTVPAGLHNVRLVLSGASTAPAPPGGITVLERKQ